ncbi:MAG: hypothetical protein HYU43_09715, partial [Armatimonadetes bacterium]|nr:hypothetical protein [Armatimonadota bacterium]
MRSPALLSALPESYQEGIQTAAEAKRRGQDAESVALAAAQFSRALRDTSLSTNQVDALLELGTSYVELRTGTALVPLVHELLARRGSEGLSKTFLDAYGEACAVGWSGRNDLLLQEY